MQETRKKQIFKIYAACYRLLNYVYEMFVTRNFSKIQFDIVLQML